MKTFYTSTEESNFILEVIDRSLLENAIDYIRNNYSPDQIFDYAELVEWAEDEGFTQED